MTALKDQESKLLTFFRELKETLKPPSEESVLPQDVKFAGLAQFFNKSKEEQPKKEAPKSPNKEAKKLDVEKKGEGQPQEKSTDVPPLQFG